MAIFKRGNVWWFEFQFDGVRYQKSTRQGNKKIAKTLEATFRSRLALGEPDPGKPKAKNLSVNDLIDGLESDYKIRGILSVRNASAIRGVRADFGANDVRTFSAKCVDAYIERRLADGAKPATVNRVTELVRRAFRLAVERGELEKVPAIRHLSEAGNARKGFFGPAEFERLVPHLPEDLRDFARFAFLTGWRKGEVSSLKWCDVEDGEIRLRGENAKNGEPRKVVLEGELERIIERRRAVKAVKAGNILTPCEFIFHRAKGGPVKEFRKSWRKASKAAGLGPMLFHDLRRSAVRNMVRGGVPQNVAMKISGHKTASMFRRYDVGSETDLREAMKSVEAYNAAALAKAAVR